MVKRISCRVAVLLFVFVFTVSPARAEEWNRAYINALPDSAFAVIETMPDGKKVRHLPHHDNTGALDIPHLKSARGRLKQVKWTDPASEGKARDHLEEHWQEYRKFIERGRHGQ